MKQLELNAEQIAIIEWEDKLLLHLSFEEKFLHHVANGSPQL